MIKNSQINKEMNPLNIVYPVSKPEYWMLLEHPRVFASRTTAFVPLCGY